MKNCPFFVIVLFCIVIAVVIVQPAKAETLPNLFFSEYVEGSSYNKALEIYNPTDSAIDLSGYKIEEYANSNTSPSYTRSLAGLLAAGDVYVLCNNQNSPKLLTDAGQCDLLLGGSILSFNGNDSLVLALANGTPIDVIGQIGSNPLVEWGNGITSTADHTLVRKCNIISGDINGSDFFDPVIEWDGYPVDTFSNLGTHSLCLSPTPSSSPTSNPTPIVTVSPEPTASPTATPTPTLTSTPTIEPTSTPTSTPTPSYIHRDWNKFIPWKFMFPSFFWRNFSRF